MLQKSSLKYTVFISCSTGTPLDSLDNYLMTRSNFELSIDDFKVKKNSLPCRTVCDITGKIANYSLPFI
jgi:hypothetical protein